MMVIKLLLSFVYEPILSSLDGLLDFNNPDKDIAKYNDDLRASLFDLLFPNGVVYNIVAKDNTKKNNNNNDKQQQQQEQEGQSHNIEDIDNSNADINNNDIKITWSFRRFFYF
eukprot:UN02909